MKRILLILIALLFAGTTFAQTQQGIVKTRGRVVNGQVVAGTKLSGATITLSVGNPQVSQAQGAFSFNVPAGKSYSLVSAKKQGYTLADPEYTRRTFKYSAGNPFYVVLEDEAQRQADINAATRKVRKTLNAQLEKREEEIETLKEQNKVTEQEYQHLLQQLYDNQSKSEQLVKEMAERYAAIDYDQLDEFNRQVQMYIEEGELLKADSLINTRGSIEERYARVKEQENVNTQREKEIRAEQASLAKSQELTQREKEDLMSDLYAKHTIYLQAYQQDSALYCLKMRADLDTTNAQAIYRYLIDCNLVKGGLLSFPDYEKYCHICLRQFMRINDSRMVAWTYTILSGFYEQSHNYVEYINCQLQALKIMQDLFEESPTETRDELAMMHRNVSFSYKDIKDYENSIKHQKEALKHYNHLNEQTKGSYQSSLMESLISLGELYSEMGDFPNSEAYLTQTVELLERDSNLHSLKDAYIDGSLHSLAKAQYELGKLYASIGDYSNSEKHLMRSLEYYETYTKIKNKIIMKIYPMLVKELDLPVMGVDTLESHRDVAKVLLCLGTMYIQSNNYDKAEQYLTSCYDQFYMLYLQKPQKYSSDLDETKHSLSILYDKEGVDYLLAQGRNDEALEMWKKVLELNPNFLDDYPDGTELSNGLKKLGLIE